MRKLLGCLLILCLLAAGLAGAAAETTVTEHEVKVYKLELNEDTGTFLCQAERGGTYQVVDAQCNALSDKYGDMDIRDGFFRVSNENKTNRYGLLDGQGRMIIPMQYGDIKVQSERWQMAYVLKDATAENHDYETWGSGDSKPSLRKWKRRLADRLFGKVHLLADAFPKSFRRSHLVMLQSGLQFICPFFFHSFLFFKSLILLASCCFAK